MSDAAMVSNDGKAQVGTHAWREEFRRRMAERGVTVRLPRPGATWAPPANPLPIDADEMSRFVVQLREAGKL